MTALATGDGDTDKGLRKAYPTQIIASPDTVVKILHPLETIPDLPITQYPHRRIREGSMAYQVWSREL